MPDITNPQVIRFVNERVRPICDKLFSVWKDSGETIQEYNSGNIGSLINDAGAGNNIADGASVDGRNILTGGDVYNVITALQQLINYVENAAVTTADRRDVITKPHVNRR